MQFYAYGNIGVITYSLAIMFAMAAQNQTVRGRDMVFLMKAERKRLVAADQFSTRSPTGRIRLILNRQAIPAALKS